PLLINSAAGTATVRDPGPRACTRPARVATAPALPRPGATSYDAGRPPGRRPSRQPPERPTHARATPALPPLPRRCDAEGRLQDGLRPARLVPRGGARGMVAPRRQRH